MHTGTSLIFLVIVCLVLIAIFLLLFHYLFLYYLEALWYKVFGKPVLVHFYLFRKKLSNQQEAALQQFTFYGNLSEKYKLYFRHRVALFISKYEFHGRDGAVVTQELKVQIAAVWVQLTFGMRAYITDAFKQIIIYPDTYLSTFTGLAHKGEYNHEAGVVVFSQRHFTEGLGFGTAKINTGIHEFAHIIQAAATTTDDLGAAGDIYAKYFDAVLAYISSEVHQQELASIKYMAGFSFTNRHEVMAAVLESFFETPDDFRINSPALYDLLKSMFSYTPYIFKNSVFAVKEPGALPSGN